VVVGGNAKGTCIACQKKSSEAMAAEEGEWHVAKAKATVAAAAAEAAPVISRKRDKQTTINEHKLNEG